MIETAIRVNLGDVSYHRREMLDAEPIPGDGISFGELEDNLVLRVKHRLHMVSPESAYVAVDADVISHDGDDPAFALLGHGFKKGES